MAAGAANGQGGTAGAGIIIYHRERLISKTKHQLGANITKIVAEYISIVLGL